MMDNLFHDLIQWKKVVIYLNNIVVFTKEGEDHTAIVSKVLQILQDNQLSLNHIKCYFDQDEIEFLGVIVRKGQIRMDPGKVKAIQEWQHPTNKKGIRAILGFAGFYRRFGKDYAEIVMPLTYLMKDVPWKW